MFETMVSHSQWIRHAVAAAKAGNPSVAKIQLQKAAEADPDNPAIWLWMGWLADSPANAAHCLEIARSDARFEKIAVAGIEFSKALADFQLDQFSEASDQTAENADHDSAPEAASQKHQVKGPVEAVEDVVAAVESLQKEDVSELPADDVVDEISDVSTDDSPLEDEVQTVDDVQAVDFEEIEPAASQPTESSVDVEAAAPAAAEIETADVEVELMRSANELWQIAAEIVAETSSASEEDSQEQSLDQELWQPAVDEAGDDVLSVSSPEVATESEPKTVTVPEAIIDESEDDFAFSDDDSTDAEFEAAVLPEHDKVEPSPINVSVNPSLNLGDQWLGQDPVESPNAPVWRKAQ